jgi:nucleoside-diphosphate-sugar epimerase
MTPERALVTGATGFVGSHVARALAASGAEVHALVRPGARLDRVPDLVDVVTFHTVEAHAEQVAAVVADIGPDVTFHLATHFVAEHRPADIDALVESNIAAPTRLADALASGGRGVTFVNAGTAWQHVEGEPYRPKNLYAATKQAFDDVLRHYTERRQLRAVTLNLYDTYGPRDHRGKLLSALVGALRSGEPLAMGSGEQLVDFVHVDDAAIAFLHAADVARDPDDGTVPTFAISSGAISSGAISSGAISSGGPCRVRDVVELLGEVAGHPVPVRWGARPDRPGDMVTPWYAGAPLPGWRPTIGLREGLAALVA